MPHVQRQPRASASASTSFMRMGTYFFKVKYLTRIHCSTAKRFPQTVGANAKEPHIVHSHNQPEALARSSEVFVLTSVDSLQQSSYKITFFPLYDPRSLTLWENIFDILYLFYYPAVIHVQSCLTLHKEVIRNNMALLLHVSMLLSVPYLTSTHH